MIEPTSPTATQRRPVHAIPRRLWTTGLRSTRQRERSRVLASRPLEPTARTTPPAAATLASVRPPPGAVAHRCAADLAAVTEAAEPAPARAPAANPAASMQPAAQSAARRTTSVMGPVPHRSLVDAAGHDSATARPWSKPGIVTGYDRQRHRERIASCLLKRALIGPLNRSRQPDPRHAGCRAGGVACKNGRLPT